MPAMPPRPALAPLARIAVAAMVFAVLADTAMGMNGPRSCALEPDTFVNEPPLVRTYAALATGRAVTIVAVGGASTLGRAAGPLEMAWPARLAAALGKQFPAARITVLNRAVARQTAAEMLKRFDRDVLAAKPTLVIWEVGTSDAVRGEDPYAFHHVLQAGVDRLHNAGAEIVLMNMQFSRRVVAVMNLDRYHEAMRAVADTNDIPLFDRHDIMRGWAESGVFDFGITDITDNEKRQELARRLYDCIGRAVAQMIVTAAPPSGTPAVPAEAGRP